MKLSITIILLIELCFVNVYGQQDAQFSQYMFNKILLNPAASGSDGVNATVLYRTQWTNQPGSPKSFGAAIDGPVANNSIGLGLLFLNTTLGPLSFSRINTNYSFRININQESKLYLGLQAGIVQYDVNRSNLITADDITLDQTFSGGSLRKLIPDFGFGTMFKNEKFYIGLTVPHLLQSRIKFINEMVDTTGANRELFTRIFRHYYGTVGGFIPAGEMVVLQPSVLVKYVVNAPFTADLNMNVNYKDILYGGVGYRIGQIGSVIGMLGVNLRNTLRVGYSFDYGTGELSTITGGSHEIMLSYHIEVKEAGNYKAKGKSKKKGKSKSKSIGKAKKAKSKPYFMK